MPRPHALPSARFRRALSLLVPLVAAEQLAGCTNAPPTEAPPAPRNAATFDYFADCLPPDLASGGSTGGDSTGGDSTGGDSTGGTPTGPINLAARQPYVLEPPPVDISGQVLSTVGDHSELTACEPGTWDVARLKNSVSWTQRPAARVTVELRGAADCAASTTGDTTGCAGVDDVVLQLFTRPDVGLECPDHVIFETSADGVDFVEVARVEGSAVCAHDGPMGNTGSTGQGIDWLVFASDDPSATLGNIGAGWVRATAHHPSKGHFTFGEVMVMGTEASAPPYEVPEDPQPIIDLAGPTGWRAHVVSPWSALDPHAPFPPSPATQVLTPVFRNGTRLRALAVANASGGPVTLTPSISTPNGSAFTGTIELSVVAALQTARFETRADALVPVGPDGASALTIPHGEIGHLAVRVDAGDTPPGQHQATLTLDDGQGHTQLIGLPVLVKATAMPSARATGISIHDYPGSAPSCGYDWRDEQADYRRHWGVTSAYSLAAGWSDPNGNQQVDPSEIDASVQLTLDEIDRYPDANRHVIKLRAHNISYNHAANIHCFGSNDWKTLYGDWISGFAAAIHSHGFDKSKLVFEVTDEASTGLKANYTWCDGTDVTRAEVLLTVATAIHEADPSLVVKANPLLPASSATGCQDVDALECLVGQVDVWMPQLTDLDDPLEIVDVDKDDRGTFYASRQGFEELWAYNGPPWSSDDRPYDMRLIPWTLFAAGATGYGTWNMHDEATDDPSCDPEAPDCSYLAEPIALSTPWKALDGNRVDFNTTYRNLACDPEAPAVADVQTPIFASLRQAGLQQGLEDYRVLVTLRDALDQCDALPLCANTCAAAGPAEQALDDGWHDVLTYRHDTTQADTVRMDLRQRLDAMQLCLP